MKKIVLASASPRRKELLELIGLEFEVEPSHSPETLDLSLGPARMAMALSLEKARWVAPRHPEAIIIAADTIVVCGDEILGKPHTEAEACDMLEQLNGKYHRVITGFTILDTEGGKTLSQSVETRVHFRSLTPEEIEAYVASGEPLDKAGGYAIQGLGAVLVDRIDGDFYNVVGLPLSALVESLKEFDIQILFSGSSANRLRQGTRRTRRGY